MESIFDFLQTITLQKDIKDQPVTLYLADYYGYEESEESEGLIFKPNTFVHKMFKRKLCLEESAEDCLQKMNTYYDELEDKYNTDCEDVTPASEQIKCMKGVYLNSIKVEVNRSDVISLLKEEALEIMETLKEHNIDFLSKSNQAHQSSREEIMKYIKEAEKNLVEINGKLLDIYDLFKALIIIPDKDSEEYRYLYNNIAQYASHINAKSLGVTNGFEFLEKYEKTLKGRDVVQNIIYGNSCMNPQWLNFCNMTVFSPINQVMVSLAHQLISAFGEIQRLNNQTYIFVAIRSAFKVAPESTPESTLLECLHQMMEEESISESAVLECVHQMMEVVSEATSSE